MYFLDQSLLSYKFHGSDMWGIYFFIFASCELLKPTSGAPEFEGKLTEIK